MDDIDHLREELEVYHSDEYKIKIIVEFLNEHTSIFLYSNERERFDTMTELHEAFNQMMDDQ